MSKPKNNRTSSGDMYKVRIAGIGRYLPKKVQTTEDIEEMGGFSKGTLSKNRSGVVERRRCHGPEETPAKNGARASREALEEAGIRPEDLDVIINASGKQFILMLDLLVHLNFHSVFMFVWVSDCPIHLRTSRFLLFHFRFSREGCSRWIC